MDANCIKNMSLSTQLSKMIEYLKAGLSMNDKQVKQELKRFPDLYDQYESEKCNYQYELEV